MPIVNKRFKKLLTTMSLLAIANTWLMSVSYAQTSDETDTGSTDSSITGSTGSSTDDTTSSSVGGATTGSTSGSTGSSVGSSTTSSTNGSTSNSTGGSTTSSTSGSTNNSSGSSGGLLSGTPLAGTPVGQAVDGGGFLSVYFTSAQPVYFEQEQPVYFEEVQPVYLLPADPLEQMAQSLLAPDTTSTTTTIQQSFAALGTLLSTENTPAATNTQLNTDLFGQAAATSGTVGPSLSVNDMNYAIVFSPPPTNANGGSTGGSSTSGKGGTTPPTNNVYNYIKNISGVNLTHVAPSAGWQGTQQNQDSYNSNYSTTAAITSFGAYVMNQQYNNGNYQTLSATQATLMQQASSSTWLAQIASEELGQVLRQTLMYESQNYILMNELIQLNKQLLAAQVMTNTLLINNNKSQEKQSLSNAQGAPPSTS